MKKIVSIILVIILAFSLCGCISCNYKCCEKESVEAKQEMLIANTNANDGIEIALPSPTSIPTPAPTPMIVNGVEINMDPNAWVGFDRDPYLG